MTPEEFLAQKRRQAQAGPVHTVPGSPDEFLARKRAQASSPPVRAQPVPEAEATALEKGNAALRGFGQGLTMGFADELGGAMQTSWQAVANLLPKGSLEWAGIDNRYNEDLGETYRSARDMNRTLDEQAKQKAGAYFTGGDLAGGVVGTLATGLGTGAVKGATMGARALNAAKTGATLGAVAGFGRTNADLTGRDPRELAQATLDVGTSAALGGVLGAGFQAGGERLLAAWRALKEPAERGIQEAAEMAEAMAHRDVSKNLASVRGDAGGAASRVRNTVENVEGIHLAPDGAPVSAGDAAARTEVIMRELAEQRQTLFERALASGVNPDDMAVGRVGEMLSAGSKMDAAQKAAMKVKQYDRAMETLQGKLDELRGLAPDAPIPQYDPNLIARQSALRADPRFTEAKANVLSNSLDDFDSAVEEAFAKRMAFKEASSNFDGDVEKRASDLLSGRAGAERLTQLAKRYGLPALGSAIGTAVGGPAGTIAGATMGYAANGAASAIGSLAGAGMRPAFQAVARTFTSFPAVKNLTWQGVKKLAEAAPEALGPYAPALVQAAARGDKAFAATHFVLSQRDPGYQRKMKELEEQEKERQVQEAQP